MADNHLLAGAEEFAEPSRKRLRLENGAESHRNLLSSDAASEEVDDFADLYEAAAQAQTAILDSSQREAIAPPSSIISTITKREQNLWHNGVNAVIPGLGAPRSPQPGRPQMNEISSDNTSQTWQDRTLNLEDVPKASLSIKDSSFVSTSNLPDLGEKEDPKSMNKTSSEVEVKPKGGIEGSGNLVPENRRKLSEQGSEAQREKVVSISAEIANGKIKLKDDQPAQQPGTEEFRFDSSDLDTTSSDESDSEESSDEDAEPYQLLDPQEQARILMGEIGEGEDSGSENGESCAKALKTAIAGSRTFNEIEDDKVERPDVAISPETKVVELGTVESITESTILIKAATTGEYQVLEEGSVVCNSERQVIGVVADLLGRVQIPRYTVRFNSNEEINTFGISLETKIFYPEGDGFIKKVFTAPLRGLKGSDASNVYDEEPAANEVDFSDDEAEQQHKLARKQSKQGRNPNSTRASRGKLGSNRPTVQPSRLNETLNYDDDVQTTKLPESSLDDEFYTPLARPTDYSALMSQGMPGPQEDRSHVRRGARNRPQPQGRGNRNRRGGRYPPKESRPSQPRRSGSDNSPGERSNGGQNLFSSNPVSASSDSSYASQQPWPHPSLQGSSTYNPPGGNPGHQPQSSYYNQIHSQPPVSTFSQTTNIGANYPIGPYNSSSFNGPNLQQQQLARWAPGPLSGHLGPESQQIRSGAPPIWAPPSQNSTGGQGQTHPDVEALSRAADHRLDILRNLSRPPGS
ncbi:MAG: hypothetical protein M1814_004950 [Vezdaea aestivalis]|nr:MAG: hypothetical protein M1814_004950 [Vezdaea aestivalis]